MKRRRPCFALMDVIRFGLAVRALRRRRGWRQEDLAVRVRVSRAAVWRVERGRADRLTIRTLERLVEALGARLDWRLLWGGEALDRLLDQDHAALVEVVVRELAALGWEPATEVSFSIRGERGSIDVLAFHQASATLLVVEVKSVVPDVQATLVTLDRKTRLAAEIARSRGWRAARVGRLLVAPDDRTARRRVAAHGATFAGAFPARGWAVRRWLRDPTPGGAGGPFSGLLFLSSAPQASARHRVSGERRQGTLPQARAEGVRSREPDR